jgi:HEAT repeat protein
MKMHTIASLALSLLMAWAAAASADPPSEIERLIQQLGSPKFAEREAASKRLQEIGAPAIGALQKASASADPEVRWRAQDLLGGMKRAGSAPKLPILARPLVQRMAPAGIAPAPQGKLVIPAVNQAARGRDQYVRWRAAYASWKKDPSRARAALETIKHAGRELEAQLPSLATSADVEETRAMLFAALEISAAK